jgi:hypothetical protein
MYNKHGDVGLPPSGQYRHFLLTPKAIANKILAFKIIEAVVIPSSRITTASIPYGCSLVKFPALTDPHIHMSNNRFFPACLTLLSTNFIPNLSYFPKGFPYLYGRDFPTWKSGESLIRKINSPFPL